MTQNTNTTDRVASIATYPMRGLYYGVHSKDVLVLTCDAALTYLTSQWSTLELENGEYLKEESLKKLIETSTLSHSERVSLVWLRQNLSYIGHVVGTYETEEREPDIPTADGIMPGFGTRRVTHNLYGINLQDLQKHLADRIADASKKHLRVRVSFDYHTDVAVAPTASDDEINNALTKMFGKRWFGRRYQWTVTSWPVAASYEMRVLA